MEFEDIQYEIEIKNHFTSMIRVFSKTELSDCTFNCEEYHFLDVLQPRISTYVSGKIGDLFIAKSIEDATILNKLQFQYESQILNFGKTSSQISSTNVVNQNYDQLKLDF